MNLFFCKGVLVLKNLPLSLRLHTQFMDEPVEEPARYYAPQSAVAIKKVADGVGPAHVCGYMDGG